MVGEILQGARGGPSSAFASLEHALVCGGGSGEGVRVVSYFEDCGLFGGTLVRVTRAGPKSNAKGGPEGDAAASPSVSLPRPRALGAPLQRAEWIVAFDDGDHHAFLSASALQEGDGIRAASESLFRFRFRFRFRLR